MVISVNDYIEIFLSDL